VLNAKQGQRFGNLLIKKYDVRNKPTVVIANSNGTEINRIVGYDPPAEEFKSKIEQASHKEANFDRLNEANKNDPTYLARLLAYPEQQDKVIPIFEKLVTIHPEDSTIIIPYINFCARTGHNKEKALELADHFFQKSSTVDLRFILSFIELLIYKNQINKIIKIQNKFIKNNPDIEVDFLVQLGCLYQNMKKYDDAFIAFESCIKKYPKDFNPYYQYGRTAVASKSNLKLAEKYLKSYLSHKPEEGMPSLATAHWRLGKIYEIQMNYDAANKEYEKALKLNPELEAVQQALLYIKNKLGAKHELKN